MTFSNVVSINIEQIRLKNESFYFYHLHLLCAFTKNLISSSCLIAGAGLEKGSALAVIAGRYFGPDMVIITFINPKYIEAEALIPYSF